MLGIFSGSTIAEGIVDITEGSHILASVATTASAITYDSVLTVVLLESD